MAKIGLKAAENGRKRTKIACQKFTCKGVTYDSVMSVFMVKNFFLMVSDSDEFRNPSISAIYRTSTLPFSGFVALAEIYFRLWPLCCTTSGLGENRAEMFQYGGFYLGDH